jgi:hypothetical protein
MHVLPEVQPGSVSPIDDTTGRIAGAVGLTVSAPVRHANIAQKVSPIDNSVPGAE